MRIVSLLPSATEILCALGLEDQVVGITHSCDYPPAIRDRPRVTRTGIPKDAPSRDIDRLVRERHRAGLPLYEIDEPLLAALRPDLLVTQGLCEVCAVADEVAKQAAGRLPGNPRVLSLAPRSLAGVLENLLEIGALTGREGEARDLAQRAWRRVEAIARVTARVTQRPRVSLLEWIDPPYACGNWTPELVALAGGTEGHGLAGQRSRLLRWEEITAWQPQVLVLACCGLDLSRTAGEIAFLERQPGFAELPSVASGRIHLVDGVAGFSRPGPRLIDGLELLAHWCHPDRFPQPAPALSYRNWTASRSRAAGAR